MAQDSMKEKKDFAEACGGQEEKIDKNIGNPTQKIPRDAPKSEPAWKWYGTNSKK